MYRVSLYENGAFSTYMGGEVRTLEEALGQLEKMKRTLDAKDLAGAVGCCWDRNGTPCALVIVDAYGFPIKDVEFKEQEDL